MSSIANPFAFHGRLAPKPYWVFVGLILGFRILAVIVVLFQPALVILTQTDFLLVFVAILIGKRMKDFGVPAIWGWVAVALISFILPIAVVLLSPRPAGVAAADAIPPWLGLLVLGALLALIVGVGVKRGDAGRNRYGDVSGPGWFGTASG